MLISQQRNINHQRPHTSCEQKVLLQDPYYPPPPLLQVTYPLDERGVVLLRGSNLDDSGADSNGAGKTTLAMSALWALAGVVDARYYCAAVLEYVRGGCPEIIPAQLRAPALFKQINILVGFLCTRSVPCQPNLPAL